MTIRRSADQDSIYVNHDSFSELGLSGALLGALEAVGYRTPTPIQSQAIPHLLAGRDLLGIAQTGTGKTAAFGLPLLQRLAADAPARQMGNSARRGGRPRALILAPTRELALQIDQELDGFGRQLPLSHAVIFGGVGQRPQIAALARGLDVVVATPGRLLDLMGQGHVDLSGIEVLVLDEADRLLDMGFIRDVRRIVGRTPATRQSLLFSATMPAEVAKLAAELLDRPVRVDVSPKTVTVARIRQRLIRVEAGEKRWVLEHLLRDEDVTRSIVFTRTKHGANKVAKNLAGAGIEAEAIHGNKSQNARQRALQSFKDGTIRVLVATDIAARGIDVQAVSHVINYELPDEPESYVHRIGRTGRAGAGGVAWSLCEGSEMNRLRGIERLVGKIPDEAQAALAGLPPAHERPRDSASAGAGARHRPAGDGRADGGGNGQAPRRRRVRGGRRNGGAGGSQQRSGEQQARGDRRGTGRSRQRRAG